MGAGIAICALNAGYPVVRVERDEASVERGVFNVERAYRSMVAKGRVSSGEKHLCMTRLATSTNFASLEKVDLAIEAVFEDRQDKSSVFQQLTKVCKPGAISTTNTSYLDIDDIASQKSRPQDVISLHFSVRLTLCGCLRSLF